MDRDRLPRTLIQEDPLNYLYKITITGLATLLMSGAALGDGPAIPSSPALSQDEILALLDGKSFSFKAYDAPLSGTTSWNSKEGTVSGDYFYDGSAGTYVAKWAIKDDRSCTTSEGQPEVCQKIYAYESGFMELNADGSVHAVSVPK
jgi:hypothetical protein